MELLDPLKILQAARSEATSALLYGGTPEDFRFVFDLVTGAINHQIGRIPYVEVTHQQPVVAIALEPYDVESDLYRCMDLIR